MKRILIFYLVTFGFCALANLSDDLIGEPTDDRGRFISLQGEMMTDVEGAGFLGTGLGYGQNIVFQSNYLGFWEISMKFCLFVDTQLLYDGKVKEVYFTELNYGYEFMRHNIISFGLDTSHGLGLSYKGKVVFNNGIGVFGKIQKDFFVIYGGYGIKHLNSFNEITYERVSSYFRLEFQYRL